MELRGCSKFIVISWRPSRLSPDAEGWPTLPELIIFLPDPQRVQDTVVTLDASIESVDGVLLDTSSVQLRLLAT